MIQKITRLEIVNNEDKTFNIFDGIKVSSDVRVTSSKSWNLRNYQSGTLAKEIDEFQPQDMELTFNLTENEEYEFISHMSAYDQKYTLRIFKEDRERRCDFIVREESLQIINNAGTVKRFVLKITRITDFYELKIFNYVPSDVSTTDLGYNYTYNFTYAEAGGTTTEGYLEVINDGQKNALLRIEMTTVVGAIPSVSVGVAPTATKNSYISTITGIADQVIINDARPTSKQITEVVNNTSIDAAQKRVFINSYGYLYVPIGTHKIIFRNVMSAVVFLEKRSVI